MNQDIKPVFCCLHFPFYVSNDTLRIQMVKFIHLPFHEFLEHYKELKVTILSEVVFPLVGPPTENEWP